MVSKARLKKLVTQGRRVEVADSGDPDLGQFGYSRARGPVPAPDGT